MPTRVIVEEESEAGVEADAVGAAGVVTVPGTRTVGLDTGVTGVEDPNVRVAGGVTGVAAVVETGNERVEVDPDVEEAAVDGLARTVVVEVTVTVVTDPEEVWPACESVSEASPGETVVVDSVSVTVGAGTAVEVAMRIVTVPSAPV